MGRLTSMAVLLIVTTASFAQNRNNYNFSINLNKVQNDKIRVDLITPLITKKTITYHIPKIVPGTYSDDDYGRYIEDLTATDKKGNKLGVTRVDVNSWSISNADRLFKISYLVNDVFDDTSHTQIIFEPAGSNIQKDSNYIINNHCFFGYFDGMKERSYVVNFIHPKEMYGSTALIDEDKSNTADRFTTSSYNILVDNPFMYDVPDTTVMHVGSTDVLVSVYSPNKKLTSSFLASKLDPLLKAQTKYLGGTLPVKKYAFIIYLTPGRGRSGGIGALEHSYSSLYFLIENSPDQLSRFFLDATAHEFFHIITPLSIHSEEIHYFDFNQPKMSRHLWLYEGSTEYHAHMMQEKYGLITPEEFLTRLTGKINSMKSVFNDSIPFTTLSREILKYGAQFRNVYEKGALINMCIDILMLRASKGQHGIMKLIRDLSATYGKQRPFKDSLLFDEIGKLTNPEIKNFLETYVGRSNPLPLNNIFDIVGVKYYPALQTKDSIFSHGGASFRFNQATGRLRVADLSRVNALGFTLGYKVNDEIVSVNDIPVNISNAVNFTRSFGTFLKDPKEGDSLVIKVMRKDPAGVFQPTELRGVMTKFPVIKLHYLEFNSDPTPEQLMLRNAWLKPNDMQVR